MGNSGKEDRLGTHWEGCWEDGGRRHYLCAVEEARRQKESADVKQRNLDLLAIAPADMPDANTILQVFYNDVCAEAERIMASSGMVSGAHWNAMKIVLKRRGVQIDEVQS